MRMGRITASNFHRACRTNPETPSLSLVKDVCYGSQFKSDATSWGKANEKRALNQYTQVSIDILLFHELFIQLIKCLLLQIDCT